MATPEAREEALRFGLEEKKTGNVSRYRLIGEFDLVYFAA